jgi:tetratricopeptide (TPR) repeat protein
MIPIYLVDALSDCQQALQTQEENQDNWGLVCEKLGSILQGMGWFEEAAIWHSRKIETELDRVNIYNDLGKIYLQLEMWQQAMDIYKQILELAPDYAEAHLYLAQIYENLEIKHQANECWYQTLLLQPELLNSFNPYNLGKSYFEQGELEKAINCYRVAVKKNPQHFGSYSDMAEIFRQQKQWDKAIECYHNIIKINPQKLDAFVKLGGIYLKLKELDNAVLAFRGAIKLQPNNIRHYLNLNKALMLAKKWDQVINLCQRAIQIFPDNTWFYLHLANALVKKGETERAVTNFQKACALRGWDDCASKGYEFTEDNFTHNIILWTRHLKGLAKQKDLQCLEVNCSEGMVSCWLLDNILTHHSAKLTCLDTKFTVEFSQNIRRSNSAKKVTKITGKIDKKLADLDQNTYNLIIVKYAKKKAIEAKTMTELVWSLLCVEGIMILQEYEVGNNKSLAEQPKRGITKFLRTVKGKYKILNNRGQMIIKKTAE